MALKDSQLWWPAEPRCPPHVLAEISWPSMGGFWALHARLALLAGSWRCLAKGMFHLFLLARLVYPCLLFRFVRMGNPPPTSVFPHTDSHACRRWWIGGSLMLYMHISRLLHSTIRILHTFHTSFMPTHICRIGIWRFILCCLLKNTKKVNTHYLHRHNARMTFLPMKSQDPPTILKRPRTERIKTPWPWSTHTCFILPILHI